MDDTGDRPWSPPKPPNPGFLAVMCLTGLAIGVAYTGTGIDVLAIAVFVLGLILVERAVGDWLGELVGPGLSSVILAGCATFVVWHFLGGGGRETTYGFFASAEQRGYRSLYLGRALEHVTPSGHRLRPPDSTFRAPSVSESRMATGPHPTAGNSPDAPRATSGLLRSDAPSERPLAESPRSAETRLWRDAGGASSALALNVPSLATTGQTLTLSARITAGGQAVTEGSVGFTLNGHSLGTAAVRPDGTATVTFVVRAPGTYTVRARFTGTSSFASSSAGSTLTILPGRS